MRAEDIAWPHGAPPSSAASMRRPIDVKRRYGAAVAAPTSVTASTLVLTLLPFALVVSFFELGAC